MDPCMDVGTTFARAAHAYGVSGDALILWGGFSNTAPRRPPEEVIAVYNLNPILRPSPTAGSGSGSDTAPSSGSGLGTGAIVGCAVVIAMVVLTAVGFVPW